MTSSLLSQSTKGALAIAIGAGLWGLFWIPLRYLSDAGFGPLWSSALVLAGPYGEAHGYLLNQPFFPGRIQVRIRLLAET